MDTDQGSRLLKRKRSVRQAKDVSHFDRIKYQCEWFREMDFVAFSRALQVNVIMFSPVDSCYSFRPYFVAADLPTIFMHCGVLGDDAFSHRDKRDDSLVHCEALIPTESGAFFAKNC